MRPDDKQKAMDLLYQWNFYLFGFSMYMVAVHSVAKFMRKERCIKDIVSVELYDMFLCFQILWYM